MAIALTTVWNANASGTGSMVNGGGFNTGNANFISDLAATVATGNAPVVTSATYTFVAGDVGALVYIKSGTNWTPGFYPIASVAGGAATLNATIGAASQFDSVSGMWKPNTVAGCATTASPTAGTGGVNYSFLTAAILTLTDLTCTTTLTTVASVTGGFTPAMVGNVLHLNSVSGVGTLVGWYEIVSYTNGNTVVVDRSPAPGAGSATAGNCKVGGALSFSGALEDAFLEGTTATTSGFQGGNVLFIKLGSYTPSGVVSVASTLSTAAVGSLISGYQTVFGDEPTGANRPTIACGANAFALGQFQSVRNVIFTSSAAGGVTMGTGAQSQNCKVYNSSSTTTRIAITAGAQSIIVDCEAVSLNGVAISTSVTETRVVNCYVHDSDTGISSSGNRGVLVSGCLFEAFTTVGLVATSTSGNVTVEYSTFYGREAKIGTGINFNANPSINNRVWACIFYGLATGINVSTALQTSNWGDWNDFFNNTADVALWNKGIHDKALDPTFAGATQTTGTTATTSASTLTQSGGNFAAVVDNVSVLHVVSGTGVTVGNYLITGHATTTLTTNNALGTSSGGDVVYFVTTGHNFALGTNLKARGGPSSLNGSGTSQYVDPGAAQRQEAGGSAVFPIFHNSTVRGVPS